jgi:hypothetical protein
MTVQCVTCASFSLQRAKPDMVKNGFGHCEHRAKFVAHLALLERDCEQHKPEAAEVVQKRRAWLKGRGE